MNLIKEEFDVDMPTNTGAKVVHNANLVEFDGESPYYYGVKVANKYGYVRSKGYKDIKTISFYHFNMKHSYTLIEGPVPYYLVKHAAKHI